MQGRSWQLTATRNDFPSGYKVVPVERLPSKWTQIKSKSLRRLRLRVPSHPWPAPKLLQKLKMQGQVVLDSFRELSRGGSNRNAECPILRVAVTSPRSEDAIVKCFDSPMFRENSPIEPLAQPRIHLLQCRPGVIRLNVVPGAEASNDITEEYA